MSAVASVVVAFWPLWVALVVAVIVGRIEASPIRIKDGDK